MYARSTTIQAQPSKIDAGIAHVNNEIMPQLQGIEGFIGMSLLVDRQSGRCIATTAWRDDQALSGSAATVRPVRDRAVEVLGGTSSDVENWEIAVVHRDHQSADGACVRCAWLRTDPGNVDQAIDAYRMALPRIEELDGFCSASLMVDRDSGRCVSTVTYDGADALRRSREQATMLRTSVAQQAGAEVMDVAEFELAMAHLRVPELA